MTRIGIVALRFGARIVAQLAGSPLFKVVAVCNRDPARSVNDLIALLGPVSAVQVTASRLVTGRPTADNAVLSLPFASGAVGSVLASFCVDDGNRFGSRLTVGYAGGVVTRRSTVSSPVGDPVLSLVTAAGPTWPQRTNWVFPANARWRPCTRKSWTDRRGSSSKGGNALPGPVVAYPRLRPAARQGDHRVVDTPAEKPLPALVEREHPAVLVDGQHGIGGVLGTDRVEPGADNLGEPRQRLRARRHPDPDVERADPQGSTGSLGPRTQPSVSEKRVAPGREQVVAAERREVVAQPRRPLVR